MKYMKNRSGVVFQLQQHMLDDPKLGFTLCDVEGNEVKVEVAPLEERLATKKVGRKKAKKTG
jgi:hypothetical protein